jgi:hypothetical protein
MTSNDEKNFWDCVAWLLKYFGIKPPAIIFLVPKFHLAGHAYTDMPLDTPAKSDEHMARQLNNFGL